MNEVAVIPQLAANSQQTLTLIHDQTMQQNLDNQVVNAAMGEVQAGLRKLKAKLIDQITVVQEQSSKAKADLDKAIEDAGKAEFESNEIICGFRDLFAKMGLKEKLEFKSVSLIRLQDKDVLIVSFAQPKTDDRWGTILDTDIKMDAPKEILDVAKNVSAVNKQLTALNKKLINVETESRRTPELALQARSSIAVRSLRKNEEHSKLLDEVMSKTVMTSPLAAEALECLKDA